MRAPGNLHLVQVAAGDRSTRPLNVTRQKLRDSFFVRVLAGLLVLALPLFIVASLAPDLVARWGIGAQVVAIVLLIGVIALAARWMILPITALSSAAARVESGDFSARVIPGGSGEMRQLGQTFNFMLERLARMLFRLRGEVAESAAQLASAAGQLVVATKEQTAASSETSASMEELSRSSIAIADTAAGVAAQAGEVRGKIALAQIDLKASTDRATALARRVGEIEGILVLINDIADQTNLLALNAAIEAARAGEAGRGFAVVADEVRRLAERSKAAAAQIVALVSGAQTQSRDTVTAVENRGRQMQVWLEMMEAMAGASGQVQLATREQRSMVDKAVIAIELIAENSRSVAATAQEIAVAASRQGQLAAELAWSRDERVSP
jgi:methyl-accepting chemotaxis protein